MATRKVEYQSNTQENNDFLQSIRNTKAEEKAEENTEKTTEEKKAEPENKTENTENKKVLVNFKISEKTLNELRKYCSDNDMTLTAGIKKAIREMLGK